jgi:hypothetical protein
MNMKPTEHSPKTTRVITGLFAMLGGFFRTRGTGAPSAGAIGASKIRLLAGGWALIATAAFFAFTGTALAAPEAPLTEPAQSITATTAVLHGVLNPATKAKTGWYFEYSTELTCENGLKTPRHLEEEVQAKPEAEVALHLEPSQTYAFCLVARAETAPGSEEFETTQSLIGQSFTTLALPPTVEGESVSGVKATEATFEASLNPNNQATTYTFEYASSEAVIGTAGASRLAGGPLTGYGSQGASISTGAVLEPHTTYYYRVVAENTKGEKAKPGKIESFTTYTPPEAPHTTEPAKSITGTTAVLEGVLNPGAKAKEGWYFAYDEGSSCTGAGEQRTGQEPEVEVQALPVEAEVTNLQPNRKYTFCLVAANDGGESAQSLGEVHLSTSVVPPTIDSESATGVKAAEATLHATINPNNQATKYQFEYSTTETSGSLTGTIVKVPSAAGTIAEAFEEHAVEAPTEALTPHTTYYYRVVAKNAKSEESKGKVEHFTTGPLETPQGRPASEVSATTATLHGVLNPGGPVNPASYEFRYRRSKTECEGENEKATTATAAAGAKEEPAGAPVSELLPNTTYTYCLRESNSAGEAVTSAPVTFRTLPEAYATDPASTSITLHAVLDPEGSATTYHFEYATEAEYASSKSYGSQASSASAGAGAGVVSVEAHVQHLTAASAYHFRVVATNAAHETFASEDQTFTTQAAGGSTDLFKLPDNRSWEMVTPVQKNGALFGPGGAIAAVASVPHENEPEGTADQTVSVLSTRTSAGWSSRTISAPHLIPGQAQEDNEEYLTFSEDLSGAIVEPSGPGFEQLSPQATEPTPYLHTLLSGGNVSEPCEAVYTSAESCYAPLVSPSDDTASPLEPFGELLASGVCAKTFRCGPKFKGGTPDMSHLVLTSQVPLTSTPAPTGSLNSSSRVERQPDVYEYSTGELQLLSILPGQTTGSPELQLAGRAGIGAAELGKGAVAARHAISDNGARVALEERQHHPGGESFSGLYLRDVVKGETIRLDEPASEPGTEASIEPEYVDANSEGSRIFFLDGAKLTADSGAHGIQGFPEEDRPDLYECEIVEIAGKDHCDLTDLTPEVGGESARVASVLGVSEDGSYVYFAAGGGLGIVSAGGCKAENLGEGEEPPANALCNVFVRHDGVTKFVAALSQQDEGDWINGPSLTGQGVRVSPNGGWLAFLSDRGLAGYDTRSAATGQPVSEAYIYHAPANLQTEAGTLSCASCDPSGARPAGGASVPGWPGTFQSGFHVEAYYQPRYLTDEGRLFFNSPDALVPLDVSKQSEVYEYEPLGAGTCTESTSSGSELYVPREHGCVALISTGTAAEGSRFLEASAGGGEGEAGEAGSAAGRDVFFLTSEKVLPQDVDTAPDVYDAHECTSASPCIAPPSAARPCETEASCKAPPTPQPTIYAAPATATFSGPGNLIPPPVVVPEKVTKKTVRCKHGDVKNKRGKCVPKKKKKKTKAKKSAHANRRTHS